MKGDTKAILDRRRIRLAFDGSASRYDEAAVLQRHVADELLERLSDLDVTPRRVLDLGCGTGYLGRRIVERHPSASVYAMDIAAAMARHAACINSVRALCGDAERIPFAAASFDLVVSNMTLQWCDHLALFEQVREVLEPDGLWLFSTVGPDTLMELRQAWRAVDEHPHVHEFIDMHHLGDALLALGFVDPVLDVDRINVTYPDVAALLRDLKTLGVVNASRARSRGMLGRRRFAALVEAYEGLRGGEGDLPSTWEIVYGQAWLRAPGSVRVKFEAGAPVR